MLISFKSRSHVHSFLLVFIFYLFLMEEKFSVSTISCYSAVFVSHKILIKGQCIMLEKQC